jgi:hypothetical protein
MGNLMDYPRVFFLISLLVLWISERIGTSLGRKRPMQPDVREDYGTIFAATLTLLGLIIGFSFSMAISRYDQRKNYEEAEANAIGTEYVRADLLPPASAARVRVLLKNYLDQRILFYETRDRQKLEQIDTDTARLQRELWTTAQAPASAQPSPVIALAVAGMNDVLNSQGYTQAAWWNRIPGAAWALLGVIAICCSVMVGYGSRHPEVETMLFLILPLVVSISFFLIADIDSPRSGIIHVHAQNLTSLSRSLQKN